MTPALPPPPVPPTLATPAEEVVQLAQAQVPNDVLLAYIEGTTVRFDLGAAQILYLTDLGVPAETIAAMVRRDQVLRDESKVAALATPTAVEQAMAAPTAMPEPDSHPTAPVDRAVERQGPPPAFTVVPTTETVPTEPAPQPQQVTHNHFYNALSPYGTWRDLPDYGWVWQPSAALVEPEWRPYFNGGRWLWTDHGWYWHSYYSWGWAPFHYGRWHRSPSWGWVWVPGSVWGPAWVTWRYYDGFCGWAPLPPTCGFSHVRGFTYYGSRVGFSFGFGLTPACYAFVPVTGFYVARPWVYRVSPRQVNQFYGNTTVINNYIHGNNNTIINQGIGTELVSSRTELRKVRVTDTAGLQTGTAIRGERLSRDGSTLAVYRPQLPESAPRPPAAITQRQEQAKSRADSLLESRPVQAARVNAAATDNQMPQHNLDRSLPAPNPQRPTRTPGRELTSTGGPRGDEPGSVVPRSEPQLVRPDRPSTVSRNADQGSPVRPGNNVSGDPRIVRPADSRPSVVADRPTAAPARPTIPERSGVSTTLPSRSSPAPSTPSPTLATPSMRPSPIARPEQPARPAQPFTPSTTLPSRPSTTSPARPSFSTQPRVQTYRPAPTTPTPSPIYRSNPSTVTAPQAATPSPIYRSAPPARPSVVPSPSVQPSAPLRIQSPPTPAPSAPAQPSVNTPPRVTTPSPAPARPSAAPSSSSGSRPNARPQSR